MINKNYFRIFKLALPIIIANASVPLLGLVDTAAVGQTGTAADLGAIALASLIFSFVYWGFGFLRMGTTGFVAQAMGAKDMDELHAVFFRAVFMGVVIGLFLIIAQRLIGEVALSMLSASAEVKSRVADYFYIRIWGAPATLITFSILGTLIGMGLTRSLLFVQLLLNGLNVVLNLLFVVAFDLGVKGVAWGTLLAEWITLFFAFRLLTVKMSMANPWVCIQQLRSRIWSRDKLVAFFKLNGNIMIRTLALLSGFAWFANQGAKFGDQILAANHVLLQFVSLSAFFLDGFAHVAEMLTGKACGARDRTLFIREVKHSSILAAVSALILSIGIATLGQWMVPLLTNDVDVRTVALQHAPYAAFYILLSFAAFQLDGVFIGISRSKEMRNAALVSLLIFVACAYFLTENYQNRGLWMAFIIYVVARAVTLGLYYPRVIAAMKITSRI